MDSSSSSSRSYYSITLAKELSTYDVAGRTQAYRLIVSVTDATGLNDPNIFLYLEMPSDAAGNDSAVFQSVCSPLDLETYPVGAATTNSNGFFRLAQADLIHGNASLLEDTWRLIVNDRDELVRSLTKMSNLELMLLTKYDSTMVGSWTDVGARPVPAGAFGTFTIEDDNLFVDIRISGMTATGALTLSVLPSTGPDPGVPVFTQQAGFNMVRISVPVAPGLGSAFNGTWTVERVR